ncbi:DUF1559 domain-containing protein [Rhodopirellula bahusiensis]|uniref:DUF1559 domain-containing protein n=2 Tax=Rhodopirellula bahusiensis TaxID=2014065 RepID=UPI003266B120
MMRDTDCDRRESQQVMRFRRSMKWMGFLTALGISAVLIAACETQAQDQLRAVVQSDLLAESGPIEKIGGRYVPDDAIALLRITSESLWDNEMFQLFPTEVFRVQALETVGFDPMDVREVRASFAISPTTGQPEFGGVVTMDGNVDQAVLLEALDANPQPMQIDGRTVYQVQPSPPLILCQLEQNGAESEVWYIGTSEYLERVVQAKAEVIEAERGPLPNRVAKLPARDGLSLVVEMQSIRPMVSGLAMNAAGSLPPRLQVLGQVPGLTDAVLLHLGLVDQKTSVELTVVAIDESAAEQIELIVKDSLIEAEAMADAAIQNELNASDMSPAMRQATEAYAERITALVKDAIQPIREGTDLSIAVESEMGIATTGVLVGLLLPAVQAAREAARRMQSSNNVKQIMLAMHNHHSAYRELPLSAIVDDDGNPLLSWRVALLPFMDEQELYNQFKLDEPWDSDHNLPLAQQIPSVYQPLRKPVEPGHTIYQAVVGDSIGLKPMQRTGFREFLDGLSNSVFILETNADQAVLWTKPEDLNIDLDNPLKGLGSAWQGGFHVGMGDGAVKFITEEIDPDLFRKMLTRAGREVVDIP